MTTTPLLEKESAMAERNINLDDDALAAAAAHFETQTAEDTVNAALRAAASRHGHTGKTARQLRAEALDRLAELGDTGVFDDAISGELR